MSERLGTAVAYRDQGADTEQSLRFNPGPDEVVQTDQLYMIVKQERGVTAADVKNVLTPLVAKPPSAG